MSEPTPEQPTTSTTATTLTPTPRSVSPPTAANTTAATPTSNATPNPPPNPIRFEAFLLALGHQLPNHEPSIGVHITKTPDGHTAYLPVDESHPINTLQLMLGNTAPFPPVGPIPEEIKDQFPCLFGNVSLGSRMYVRPSYPLLFNVIMGERRRFGYEALDRGPFSRGMILTGNDGIGKSTFLGYFMWRLLHPPAGQPRPPIIFHNFKGHAGAEAWMIDGAEAPPPIDGVLQFAPPITRTNIHFADGGPLSEEMIYILNHKRNSYYLVDSNVDPESVTHEHVNQLQRGFALVAAQPYSFADHSRYPLKYWRRHSKAQTLYCPVWSLEELLEARYICYGTHEEHMGTSLPNNSEVYYCLPIDDDDVRRSFKVYGGSIRKLRHSIKRDIVTLQEEVLDALRRMDPDQLRQFACHGKLTTEERTRYDLIFHYDVYVHDAINTDQYQQYRSNYRSFLQTNHMKALPFHLLEPTFTFASEFVDEACQLVFSRKHDLTDFIRLSSFFPFVREIAFREEVLRGMWSMSQSKPLWRQGGFAFRYSRQLMITLDPHDPTKVTTVLPEANRREERMIRPMPIKIIHNHQPEVILTSTSDIDALPHHWRLQGCSKNFPTIDAVVTPYWALKITVSFTPYTIHVKELVELIAELKKFQEVKFTHSNEVLRVAASPSKIKLVFVVPDLFRAGFRSIPINFQQDDENRLPIPVTEFEIWIMSFNTDDDRPCNDLDKYPRQLCVPVVPPCTGTCNSRGCISWQTPETCDCHLNRAYCDQACRCQSHLTVTCTNRDPWAMEDFTDSSTQRQTRLSNQIN